MGHKKQSKGSHVMTSENKNQNGISRDESQRGRIEEELGDVLFTLAQLARHLDIEPEQCLQNANRKFERRFFGMLAGLGISEKEFSELAAEKKESLWQGQKLSEPKS
jgi:uncharacterized protein YabN with tetrapyrrole methylase and pyrophosphatase domain